jgi:hypothetical protein
LLAVLDQNPEVKLPDLISQIQLQPDKSGVSEIGSTKGMSQAEEAEDELASFKL